MVTEGHFWSPGRGSWESHRVPKSVGPSGGEWCPPTYPGRVIRLGPVSDYGATVSTQTPSTLPTVCTPGPWEAPHRLHECPGPWSQFPCTSLTRRTLHSSPSHPVSVYASPRLPEGPHHRTDLESTFFSVPGHPQVLFVLSGGFPDPSFCSRVVSHLPRPPYVCLGSGSQGETSRGLSQVADRAPPSPSS